MKKFILLSIVFFATFSCNKTVKKESLSFDHLNIEKMIFASNDSTKPHMKMSLYFTYPVKFYNDTLLHKMQQIFITAFAGEEYAGRSPQGAFEAFEKNLTDESVEMASYLGKDLIDFSEYFQNITTTLVDSAENTITIKTETENYMGGAHGSRNILYYNIDLKEAKLLHESDIFNPGYEEKLSTFISEELQQKYGASIDDVLFEKENVKPNNNFYLKKDGGITYLYNEYEIAPYSEGIIEVSIPANKINEIIRPGYMKKQDD